MIRDLAERPFVKGFLTGLRSTLLPAFSVILAGLLAMSLIAGDRATVRGENAAMVKLQGQILKVQQQDGALLAEAATYRANVTVWHANEQRMQRELLARNEAEVRQLNAILERVGAHPPATRPR